MSKITLYHNTSNANAISISKEGIKGGMRLSAYGKGSEAEGAGVWCSSVRGYGYGGATITFEIDEKDKDLIKQNDTEYIVYRDIAPDEIVDIDLVVSKIVINNLPSTVESTIPLAIKKYGKEKLYTVFKKYEHNFVEPYNMEQFQHLVETGEKYCKGKIQLTEGIHLYGFVKDTDGNSKVLEYTDYPDKKSFEDDLRGNGYTVRRINDNRDMYIMDHSDFLSISHIKSEIAKLKQDYKYNKEHGYETLNASIESKIKDLQRLIDDANKISLTEGYEYQDRQKIFNDIKNLNPNANWNRYKNMPINRMLAIKQGYLNKISKKNNEVTEPEELIPIGNEEPNLNKDYDTDESISAKTNSSRGLEGINEAKHPNIQNNFVLKGIQDGKSFNIAWDSNKQRLEDFKDEISVGKPNITMWIEENDDIPNASKKLEEASRNELLAKSKAETITRYNKSAGYKGFSLVDIDTTAIKTRDAIVITNRVGNYFDTIELEDILYWVGLEVDEARDKKMTLEVVRRALLGAMDGMDIKVDCNCGDFVYRFAYMSTVLEYKYGKPENRPSNITNPNGYGAMCKHLIALLSNKSWIKQVASTLQQWIVDEIEWVRNFLKVSEEDFKLPDEYARYLGKHGAMKKTWDKIAPQEDEEQQEDSDETNEDTPETEENDEATNDTPEEKATLNNQTNMPKAFRDNKQDEEDLEEK